MGNLLAPSHLLLIFFFVLLIFGPKKLPELGNALGRTLKGFKEGAKEIMNDEEFQSKPIQKTEELRKEETTGISKN
ncbi:twin-arginine translocase TatA/TatE family subunit [Ferviditalea candida]|uniref:Sec-independent protein translocase protein TatA n=1 Tax=Ferviditalea candida TaxID=3108399 RepID=A0ABU5ZNA1_9BACL|nr:twin-arginine translocase TatA/TatE family subunit [Paenibacillaceae bacterium T2]